MSVHNCLSNEGIRAGDVYIGRFMWPDTARRLGTAGIEGVDGSFGNPFKIGPHGTRAEVVAKFEDYARRRLTSDTPWRERVKDLHGRRLFCYCAPRACHGEVLERLAAELQVSP